MGDDLVMFDGNGLCGVCCFGGGGYGIGVVFG